MRFNFAADVMTYLSRCLYRDSLMAAFSITAECGAWWGLQYDIHWHQPTSWSIKRARTSDVKNVVR